MRATKLRYAPIRHSYIIAELRGIVKYFFVIRHSLKDKIYNALFQRE